MLDIIKNEDGERALNRVMAFGAAVILSAGFIKEASSHHLEWLDYVGYACGMAVSYAPTAAAKMIAVMKTGKAPEEPKP